MEFYTKDFEVDIHDVDFNGVARTSTLMKHIQTAAQSQLTDNKMSFDQLRGMERAFLLSRIKMEFTSTVRAYDRLTARTYPCPSRGFSFLRCYELIRGGEVIGRAVAVWALINTATHALVKVNDFELGLSTHEPHDLALTRISLPEGMEKVGVYEVRYDSVDQNNHMNNTKYPDMYSNFLDLCGKRIEEITINYQNEAPKGDIITVYHAEENGYHYFKTVRSDGKTNTEAEIRTVSI